MIKNEVIFKLHISLNFNTNNRVYSIYKLIIKTVLLLNQTLFSKLYTYKHVIIIITIMVIFKCYFSGELIALS